MASDVWSRFIARTCLPLLERRDRRCLTRASMARAQGRTLARLVTRMSSLPVGEHCGLERLDTSSHQQLRAAFRAEVPVTRYADYERLIARVARGQAGVMFRGRAHALAQTSGTTSTASASGGGERYVPQSDGLLTHHARGGAAALARLARATGPDVLGGRMLMLGGSTALVHNCHGVPVGDLSGIVANRIPWFLQGLYEPGRDIAHDPDWERKLTRAASRCARADIRLASGIPSWLLVLFERVRAECGVARVREAWPRLSGIIHGGHAIEPFISRLIEELGPETLMMEVYPSSEAFIAVGARPWRLGDGVPAELEALCDHGIVIEFMPDGGTGADCVGPEQLEHGGLYRVLVTTPGGLVRYELGDLVRGAGAGRLRFAGRVKTRISVFGEHVEGDALDAAIVHACSAHRCDVAHYHVAPVMPRAGEPRGRHQWWIEFAREPDDAAAFAAAIDCHLRAHVIDYDAHRVGELQLQPPALAVVPRGTFHAWLAGAGKLGGQHKVPQAWPDRRVADALAHAASDRGAIRHLPGSGSSEMQSVTPLSSPRTTSLSASTTEGA